MTAACTLVYNAVACAKMPGKCGIVHSQKTPRSQILYSGKKTKGESHVMQTETLPSGTILHGRYRVERALGSGGFGHVYLSTDLQTNTPYAVKEYLVTGANGKAQLEHEAQVLSHLHHPNLPAYLTAFDERGHYYVVLGYIEGNDLTDYIRVVRQKNEAIPIARLMEWILSICDA